MPLYECSKCHAVENTALGYYWVAQLDEKPPECSECHEGEWRGRFPKRIVTGADMVTEANGRMRGFLMPRGGWKGGGAE